MKLGDLGLATQYAGKHKELMGTPQYLSPEVCEGLFARVLWPRARCLHFHTESYNEKCDVYSFGIMFLEILTR